MKGYGVALSPMSRPSIRGSAGDSPGGGYSGFVQLASGD